MVEVPDVICLDNVETIPGAMFLLARDTQHVIRVVVSSADGGKGGWGEMAGCDKLPGEGIFVMNSLESGNDCGIFSSLSSFDFCCLFAKTCGIISFLVILL